MGRFILGSLAIALATTSCGGGSGGSTGGGGPGGGGGGGTMGTLKLSVTDDPFPLDLVSEAIVHVTEVKLHHEADGDSGFISLPVPPGGITIELVGLRDGLTADLTSATLLPGSYAQARLVIDDAKLTLSNGNVYSTALGNLDLTSGGTSGLKIFIDPPFQIVAGQTTSLIFDFDLSKTFHAVPANDPPNAKKFKLMPGIRATDTVNAADLNGHVTMDDGTGQQVGVDTASVYVLPPGETNLDNAVASTATTADGSYAFLGLKAGTYDVQAVKDTATGMVAGVVLVVGTTTTVDIVLTATATADLNGHVTKDDGTGQQVGVDAATVYVLPPGVTDPLQAVATTTTSGDGSYSFTGLTAGTYDLLGVKDTLQGTVAGVVLAAGATKTVDIILLPTTADLNGHVTMDDGTGQQVGVDAAHVYVLPPGVTDPAQAVASTTTSSDGSYSILGITAGTYDVLAVKDPAKGTVAGVVLAAGSTKTVDVIIQ
jgi:uncharacterized protein (DUF2141 family)